MKWLGRSELVFEAKRWFKSMLLGFCSALVHIEKNRVSAKLG
jgi:hypothetical protein